MKRYFKYIFLALIGALMTVSCLEELEPTPSMTETEEVAVLVPRVKSFANQYVTRADDNPEQTITSLKVLIFNNEGVLVNTQDIDASTRPFTLNKSMLNSPAHKEKLDAATVVMLANMNADLGVLKKADGTVITNANITSLTLEDIKKCTYSPKQTVITSTTDNFNGFPMIGGKVVDLSLTSSNAQQNPEVVDLKILYAKVNFKINVEPDGDNERVDPSNTQQMQFQLSGYSVYNVSATTSFDIPTNAGEPVRDIFGNIPDEDDIADIDEPTSSAEYAYTTTGISGTASGTTTLGAGPLEFTFYMAESRYNHYDQEQVNDSDPFHLKGIYPDDSEWLTLSQDQDVKGWTNLSAEEKKLPQNKLNGVKYGYDHLIQQFKPRIVEKATNPSPGAGLAAYVLLTGTYKDYRGTSWNVNYKVYLGKDNSQNFHVDRNSEYTNYISIKGIRNRQEGAYGDKGGDVWIDHRVNVTLNTSQNPSDSRADNCVSITRETLIDAHIEVRPLRLQWTGTTYDRVNVYLPTETVGDQTQLIDWIGIEKFTGENCQDEATYCFSGEESTGKRKYFTTGLINELQTMGGDLGVKTDEDGRQFLDCYNEDCVWIYFDENTATTKRQAVIRLEFYKNDKVTAIEEYTVIQSGLQTIDGTGYIVESYEEYLHSYASVDKYNLATSPVDYTQQGLVWGFDGGKPLSEDIIVSSNQILPVTVNARYDYFHKSDANGATYYTYTRNATTGNWANWADATPNYGTGIIFTDRASAKRSLTVKDMGSIPDNAYQYCLSKNKFNEEDNTLDIHWYLPDVYELKAVLQAETSSADFEAGTYYWSSQPSFTDGQPKDEDPSKARAVSFNKSDTQTSASIDNQERKTQNRIRCFYSKDGIKGVNMTDRVPDGLGGNFSFLMKGKNGYFDFMVDKVQAEDEDAEDISFKNESFAYPTFDNPGTTFGYFNIDNGGVTVEGFSNSPTNTDYWGSYQQTELVNWTQYTYTYYTELTPFPGLSTETLILDENRQTKGGSRPSGTPKTDIAVDSTIKRKEYETILQGNKYQTNLSLEPLLGHPNPDKGTALLEISFSNNDNVNMEPQFKYSELVEGSRVDSTVRIWQVPTYAPTTYIPKADSNTDTYDGDGTSTVNGVRGQYTEAQTKARENADAAALADAKQKASVRYPNRTYTYGTPSYTRTETYTSNKIFGFEVSRDYTCTTKCTISITCTATTEPVAYYQNASGGGWVVAREPKESLAKVETDQLRIYSGNSFTITCTDPDYEITKVKVHFSGTNEIDEETSNWGATTTTYFARFVDSGIDLPQSGDQSTHLLGMEYNDSAMWQQWSGLGTQSVTLTLADFVRTAQTDVLGGLFGGGAWYTYTYEYRKAAQDLNTFFLVVDRIEVKCTEIKKETDGGTN